MTKGGESISPRLMRSVYATYKIICGHGSIKLADLEVLQEPQKTCNRKAVFLLK